MTKEFTLQEKYDYLLDRFKLGAFDYWECDGLMECTLYFQAGTNELGRIAEIEKQNPREAKEAALFHAMRDSLANPLEEPVGTAFPPGIQDGANDCPVKLEHAEREVIGFARQAARAERKLRILLERQLRDIKRLLPKMPARDDLTMTFPGMEKA